MTALGGEWIEVEGTEAKVKIPNDPEAWQLYDVKGAKRAARSLTSGLRRALKATSREEAIKIMSAALDKHTAVGSRDTEPRQVAEDCLTRGRGGDYSWSL